MLKITNAFLGYSLYSLSTVKKGNNMTRESGIGAAIGKLLSGGAIESILSSALEEKSDVFPFGLPKGVELERILSTILTFDNVVNKVRQDKKMRIAFSDDIFDSYVKLIKRGHKLTDKQVRGICFLSIPSARRDVLSKAMDNDEIDKSVEGYLILKYLKDKGLSVDSLYKIRENEFIESLPAYIKGKGLDTVAFTIYNRNISPFDNGLRKLAVLVPEVIKDLSNPKLEESAAHALFAFASYNECKEILDMVYYEFRDIFSKYYSTLKSEDLDKDDLLSDHAYTPYLDKGDYEALKTEVFRHKLKISTLTLGASFVSNVMSSSEDNTRTIDYYMDVRDSLQGMIKELSNIDLDIEEQEIRRVSEMISVFKDKTGLLITGEIESKLFPKPIISLLEKITKSLEEIESLVDSKNFADIDAALFDLTVYVAKANSEIVSMEDEMNEKATLIQDWISDPVENAGDIARVSTQINDIKNRIEDAVKNSIADSKNFYSDILSRLSSVAESSYIEPVVDLPEIPLEKESKSKYEKELESKLSKCEIALNAEREQMKVERNALNDLKKSKLKNGMSSQARGVIQKVISSPDDCSLEEILECCSLIYPDSVDVMDTAIKSSRESCFQNKATLWKNLMILINSYLVDINNGKPDSEAKKCFPVKLFSANESKTIDGNSTLKAKRTGKYKGESIYFDKHLRFGVAHNERETLRVHFSVIDGKLVIFHCGKHLDNK